MKPKTRLSLISSIAKARLAGEKVGSKLPLVVKMKTIQVDKKVKTTIIHTT